MQQLPGAAPLPIRPDPHAARRNREPPRLAWSPNAHTDFAGPAVEAHDLARLAHREPHAVAVADDRGDVATDLRMLAALAPRDCADARQPRLAGAGDPEVAGG